MNDNFNQIEAKRLTLKDTAGRLETFHDVKITATILVGEKWYKFDYSNRVSYYKPENIIFMEF